MTTPTFDPADKERALRAEADSWDISSPQAATEGDIPVIDVSEWFTTGDQGALARAGAQLAEACQTIGFHQLVGHGVTPDEIAAAFDWTRRFHRLPIEVKQRILMDRPGWPLGGVGYLPVGERKLPRRARGNLNEAFLIKGDARSVSTTASGPTTPTCRGSVMRWKPGPIV